MIGSLINILGDQGHAGYHIRFTKIFFGDLFNNFGTTKERCAAGQLPIGDSNCQDLVFNSFLFICYREAILGQGKNKPVQKLYGSHQNY